MEKTFLNPKKDKKYRLRLVAIYAGIFLFFFILQNFTALTPSPIAPWLYLLVASGLAYEMLKSFWAVDYVVTEKALVFKNNGRVSLELPYTEYKIIPRITKISENATKRGVVREISYIENQRVNFITINLNEKDFEELITLIQGYTAKTIATLGPPMGETRFTLNPQALRKKGFSPHNLPMVFFVIISLAAFYLAFFKLQDLKILYIIPVFGLPLIIVSIIKTLRAVKSRENTPQTITLREDSISFNSSTINYDSIQKILLSPPNYKPSSGYRTIKILSTDGQKYRYTLGLGSQKADAVFPEYQKFAEILEKHFIHSPEKFQYDL